MGNKFNEVYDFILDCIVNFLETYNSYPDYILGDLIKYIELPNDTRITTTTYSRTLAYYNMKNMFTLGTLNGIKVAIILSECKNYNSEIELMKITEITESRHNYDLTKYYFSGKDFRKRYKFKECKI